MKKWISLCVLFFTLFSVLASGQSIIYSEKFRIKTSQEGDTISVPVSIKDAQDLYGFHIDISYDNPNALSYLSLESGPFMSKDGASVIDEDDLALLEVSSGNVKNIISTRQGVDTGVSGTGVLFTLRFNKELADATSDLTITLAELSDPDGISISNDIHYLTLWDDTDTSLKGPGQSITFSATLEDSQSNPVGGTCKITVGGSTATMSLANGVYTHSTSFGAGGQYSWSVTCDEYYTVYDRVVVSECTPTDSKPCGESNVGECSYGIQTCQSNGMWDSQCVGETGPSPEVCDGLDNDCDGSVDEVLSMSCYSGLPGTEGVGICHAGTKTCQAGEWGDCAGQVTPVDEVCDAAEQDENCDGSSNEGCDCTLGATQQCGSNVGECSYGSQTCLSDGTWDSVCGGGTGPTSETCNNKDDDCDGLTDEDEDGDALNRACYSGPTGTKDVGLCVGGTETCQSGGWGACAGQVTPAPLEVCDAAKQDEDCDGSSNEGCDCTPGITRQCGSNVGECSYGTQTCLSDGTWGSVCEGGTGPASEWCDDKDNDCDGLTDEDEDGEALAEACYTGPDDTLGHGLCIAGIRTCMDGEYRSCDGQIIPTNEICDGKDNDCDDAKDEGCECTPLDTRECGSNVGECSYGTQTCLSDGTWDSVCEGGTGPISETCNGKDDDCDNVADEDEDGDALAETCYTGPDGTESVGLCIAGLKTCTDGSYGSCDGEITPADEACDGKDNDCDGAEDEDCECTPEETKDCGSNVGECSYGTQTCQEDGTWADSCVGSIGPTAEVCDSKDNDCDGLADDGVCGSGGSGGGGPWVPPVITCDEEWVCGTWSACVNNKKTRTCTDSNDCGTVSSRPETEVDCSDPCFNGLQDNDEEGVDCGGSCEQECETAPPVQPQPEQPQPEEEAAFRIGTEPEELQQSRVVVSYDNRDEPRRSGVHFALQIKELTGNVVAEESLGPVTIEADELYQQSLSMPLYLLGEGEEYILSAIAYEKGKEIGVYETSITPGKVPVTSFLLRGLMVLAIVAALALLVAIGFTKYMKKGD